MKKTLLILIAAICSTTAFAEAPKRPMLEQGKTWIYAYHHFEERETPGPDGSLYNHTIWPVHYSLNGDTIIEGRQYMKMYRYDERNWGEKKYFGAYREDDEGRVYMYDYRGDKKDFMIVDFHMDLNKLYEVDEPINTIIENIKVDGKLFRRYRYEISFPEDAIHDLYVGVEGVGFKDAGIIRDVLEVKMPCICDYEEFIEVYGGNFWFNASAFDAPKEIELAENERQLIKSNNNFAFNLFREARSEKSCIMSPLSITYALGMVNNGAAGQTQQEINQTLGFGEAGADAINDFCKKMLVESGTLDRKTKSLIANTIFVNEGQGYQLQDGFVQKANDYYDAQPQNRDFTDGQTVDVINQWASDHTEGMIPRVIDERTFDQFAVSYLLNALYFKGAWSSPFDAAETKDEPFGGGPVVPMMHQEHINLKYTENNLYQAVNLPYGNGAYRMTVFLPREGKTIGDVLENLDGSNWQTNFQKCQIDLKLPRFETETQLGLTDVMSTLGMPTAFTPAAEFPYFCNANVFIGGMFQVAKIRLDEQGTEAAAVTIISISTGIPETADFHATRPFLYIISEQSTGAIFFIGQYTGGVTADTPNGIATTKVQPQPNTDKLYNLQGQRLTSAPHKGIYIQNGKKVVMK